MIRSEFMAAIKQVASERGIEPDRVINTLKQAMLAAYRKDYPEQSDEIEEVEVNIDKETGEVTLSRTGKDVTPPGFGRIAAQTAKQVILQGVREAEKDAIIDEFRQKVGKVIPGMLQRYERGNWYVDVGRTIALLPKDEQVFSEEYTHNKRLKFYVQEIRSSDYTQQVIVSRANPDLVKGLFELEVPEMQSQAVVIKEIAREPGSRTKIAVSSTQEGVDPVGSMVGQRGVRVQAVTNELGGEKMDIILWSENPTQFIINGLSPAKVSDVNLNEKKYTAEVEVPDDQLSLAIGKDGQNVRLASKLTGFKIDIVGESGESLLPDNIIDSQKKDSSDDHASVGEESTLVKAGLSARVVNSLEKAGIKTLQELKLLTPDQLEETPGIGPKAVQEIQSVPD